MNTRIDPDRGVIEGAMHVDVRLGANERVVRLWSYADRLAVAPSSMDERSWRWVYPGEIDIGAVVIEEIRVDGTVVRPRTVRRRPGTARGRDFAGSDLLVAIPDGAGPRVGLRVRFRISLPSRFGRVGNVDDRIVLTGPWYPLVVGDDDAWRFDVPHRVHVRTTTALELLVGDEIASGPVVRRGAFVPVVAAPRLFVRTEVAGGVPVRIVSHREGYRAPTTTASGPGAVHDLVRVDTAARIAAAVAPALESWRLAGLAPVERPVTIAVVPSRTELVATAPGLVLASDRLYEIFPAEVTREFHDRALRRALFRHLLAPLVTRVEPVADRGWAADLRAVFLIDVDDARRHGHARTPEELIGFASFHPAVDQLLYAPQVANVDVYFGALDEPDAFRDDPERARRPRARGRRILESARDALSDEDFAAWTRALMEGRTGARDAVSELAPPLASRVDVWLETPALEVNYRLDEVRSERLPDGRHRHRIDVERVGADRPEPVEVRVEDTDGNERTAVWDGDGSRGTVTIVTPAPADDVVVDPRGRLPQSPRVADGHPRGDDATTHPFKPPIFRNFGFDLALEEDGLLFSGFVDFAMRRRFDLDSSIAATVATGEANTGGSVRYVRGIGPKRDNNARVGFASAGLSAARLHGGFVEGQTGGVRVAAVANAGFDTRRYFEDFRRGTSLSGSLRVGGVRRDGGGIEPTATLGVRGSITVPIGLRNAVLFVGAGDWTFGDALPSEHQALGGRFRLRGFETSEFLGDGSAFAVVEHRWTALADLALNILHIAWLREIQLAFFAGAGAVFGSIEGAGAQGGTEVGTGLRFHYEYGGVQPGVLAIDFALPIARDPDRIGSDGIAGRDRLPLVFHLSYDQYF